MADDPCPPSARAEPDYDCIVISDIHLGSAVCQARLLEEFLEWAAGHSRELVINGDIFDDLNFKRLTKWHFACLKVIRQNSDRPDFRLVWVRGNHDGPADIVSHIVGVEILDEYVFTNDRLRLLILHGDQFDTFVTEYPWLTELACGAFSFIQKLMPHRAARWIRRITKKWQRNTARVEGRAREYARGHGFRHVTCGHTHVPLVSEADGVRYLNTGTWIEAPPCPFLSVKGDEVVLQHWPLPAAEAPPTPSADVPETAQNQEVSTEGQRAAP